MPLRYIPTTRLRLKNWKILEDASKTRYLEIRQKLQILWFLASATIIFKLSDTTTKYDNSKTTTNTHTLLITKIVVHATLHNFLLNINVPIYFQIKEFSGISGPWDHYDTII